jgi:hypothetical protein
VAGFFDIYVLSRDRSKATAVRFLDHFLPHRDELTDEYAVPRYGDPPDITFDTADGLLGHIEHHPDEPHAIYWASKVPGDPRFAMLFPTADGHAVYGLSAEQNERELLADLMAFLNSAKGYIDFENLPADNAPAFDTAVEKFDRSR